MYIVIAVSALAAMIIDAQFIVIQRYNRPRIMRLLEKERVLEKEHIVR